MAARSKPPTTPENENLLDGETKSTPGVRDTGALTEGKAARKAVEEAPPVIKETPISVEDTGKINLLTSEVEALKASLQSERQAAEDLRKAFSEAEVRNLELAAKLENNEKNRSASRIGTKKNQELLVKCISQNLGYAGGKPVAACIIYKCLLHWRSFEDERTSVFDRIIQTIASAIEVPDNNEVLAYWLSNSATLLCLLKRTQGRRRTTSSSLIGTISLVGFKGLTKLDDSRQVEAKFMYPAQLFTHQLAAFLEKMYAMIRDNLKKEISPLLGLCVQAPKAQANNVPQQTLIAYWQSIMERLSSYLNLMKENNVPPFLVSKVFTQIFSFINLLILNSFLLRRECCSLSYGEYVEAGLAELKQWCVEATDEYAGSAWDELRRIRQAVGYLVIHQKPKMTLDEITRELCPVLSIQQIYRLSTMYWDGKYGTPGVSSDVIEDMRVMMREDSNNTVSSSFILEDDSSIPFTEEDISKSMQQVDVNDVEPPQLILENPGFSFLLTRQEGSPS